MIKGLGKHQIITRPLFYYGLIFALGIAWGMTGLFSFSLGVVVLALGIISVFILKNHGYAAPLGLILALGIFFAVCGWRQPQPFPASPGEEVVVEATALANALQGEGDSFSLSLRPKSVNGLAYTGGDVLLYGKGSGEYLYGDKLKIKGTVMAYTEYGNDQAFDYESYLLKQGFTARISTNYGGELLLLNRGGGNIIGRLASKIRLKLDDAIKLIPPKQGQYIKGVFLGEKSGLNAVEKRTLAQTGILHAFAVSGLHVGYIVALVGLIAGAHYKKRWLRLTLGFLLILFYLFIVGFKGSVLRASIMACLFLLAPVLNEKADLLNSWGLALLMVLFWKPLLILDAGFQLSFVTVAGIGILQPVFSNILPGQGWFKNAFSVTLAASFASMPLVAWYFYLASFAGWVLSPFFLIIIGLVVILGLVSALFSIFSITVASLFLISAGVLMEIVYTVADFASGLSFSWLALLRPSLWVLGIYFGIMLALPKIKKHWGKKGTYAALVFMVLLLLLPMGNRRGSDLAGLESSPDLLEVVFLDVGQGDCTVVFTPKGKTIVIDGGGKSTDLYWIGDNILAPYLQSRGVKEVELIINSHPHEDHIGGLFSVLQMFKVKGAMVSPACDDIPLQQEFVRKSLEKGCTIFRPEAGESYLLEEDLHLHILSPHNTISYTTNTANEGSLVMKLSYNKVDFLFTGDLEGPNLGALSAMPQIKAEVFKLPHHGSIASMDEDFYRMVNPQVVVVSVGKNNPFGHPSPVISDYWQEEGIPFFRTDKNGAITILSDGRVFQVQTMY